MGFSSDKTTFDECQRLGIASKDEFDNFRVSPDYEEMKRLEFTTILEYDGFKAAGFKWDDARNQNSLALWDDDTEFGFVKVVLSDYQECKRLGIATKAEFNTFRIPYDVSGCSHNDYEKCKDLGIATKAEYDTFKKSPEYRELDEMGFVSRADFDDCKRLGIASKAV